MLSEEESEVVGDGGGLSVVAGAKASEDEPQVHGDPGCLKPLCGSVGTCQGGGSCRVRDETFSTRSSDCHACFGRGGELIVNYATTGAYG